MIQVKEKTNSGMNGVVACNQGMLILLDTRSRPILGLVYARTVETIFSALLRQEYPPNLTSGEMLSHPPGSKKGNYVEFHWLEICRVSGAVIKNVRRPPIG